MKAPIPITTERIAEIAKDAIKWTPYPPHHAPQLHEVMDAIDMAIREAMHNLLSTEET
jgi:hypothetical protein